LFLRIIRTFYDIIRPLALSAVFILISLHTGYAANDTIRSISFYGNRITAEKTIRLYLALDTGIIYDSSVVLKAKNNLLGSGLFSRVDIFQQPAPSGIKLLIIVSEKSYLQISDIGGELNYLKYGYDVERPWWRARLGLKYVNFMGTMEHLSVNASIWESRSFKISWMKPFLGTRYFTDISTSISFKPDLYLPFDRFNMNLSGIAGRRIFTNSLVYISIIPSYEKKYWLDGYKDDYSELYIGGGWVRDTRNRKYDANTGLYTAVSYKTNILWPRFYDFDNAYSQLDADGRYYIRGILPSHTLALRARASFRLDSAASWDGIHAGGQSTVRGYSDGIMGNRFIANNRLLGTIEYRFPMARTPAMDYPILSNFNSDLLNFYYRLDGALFFDCGYLWHYLPNPIHPYNQHQYGYSAGSGLRITAPNLNHSLCFDYAWSLDSDYRSSWVPHVYFYIDLDF
jgi:outer membrane protein assembly factor BamA